MKQTIFLWNIWLINEGVKRSNLINTWLITKGCGGGEWYKNMLPYKKTFLITRRMLNTAMLSLLKHQTSLSLKCVYSRKMTFKYHKTNEYIWWKPIKTKLILKWSMTFINIHTYILHFPMYYGITHSNSFTYLSTQSDIIDCVRNRAHFVSMNRIVIQIRHADIILIF